MTWHSDLPWKTKKSPLRSTDAQVLCHIRALTSPRQQQLPSPRYIVEVPPPYNLLNDVMSGHLPLSHIWMGSSYSFIKYWSASRTCYLSSLPFQGLCGKPRPTLWLPTLWSSKTMSLSNRLIWAQEVNWSTSGLVLLSQIFIKLQSTVQPPFWTILHPPHRYFLWDSDFLLKYPEWRD